MKPAILRAKVRDILISLWDPCGIKANSNAQDEYDSYVSGIIRLLKADTDQVRLVRHLAQLERVSMGFSKTSPQLEHVAKHLLSLNAPDEDKNWDAA